MNNSSFENLKILNSYKISFFVCTVCVMLTSCASYRQNVMFKTDGAGLRTEAAKAEANYAIRKGDVLDLRVFTNKGELIIDPNYSVTGTLTLPNNGALNNPRNNVSFIVQEDGSVELPMVGSASLAGLTQSQADELLSRKYSEYYKEAFAVCRVLSRRVTVLGGMKGGEVVPLPYENMSVIEVIGLAGGLPQNSKAQNIRLIRGDLKNPQVQVMDLSTIEGMKAANLRVEPNDIIYIEPVRRGFRESLADVSPVISIVSVLTSTVVTILLLTQ